MTIKDALRNLISYPVSDGVIETFAIKRGLGINNDFDKQTAKSSMFRLTVADIMVYVANAPNVSEGGVSVSLSDRRNLFMQANDIYEEFGEPPVSNDQKPTVEYIEW